MPAWEELREIYEDAGDAVSRINTGDAPEWQQPDRSAAAREICGI